VWDFNHLACCSIAEIRLVSPNVTTSIWACLTRIKDDGMSILIVDKNIADLMRLADRHCVIEKGRVVWSGSSPKLLANPEILHRYLGV
jgi:branched-chain amino acid transport system ATP-binding protein